MQDVDERPADVIVLGTADSGNRRGLLALTGSA